MKYVIFNIYTFIRAVCSYIIRNSMELVGPIPKKNYYTIAVSDSVLPGVESHQFGDKHFQFQRRSGGEGAEAVQAKKCSKTTVTVAYKIDFGLSDIEH